MEYIDSPTGLSWLLRFPETLLKGQLHSDNT